MCANASYTAPRVCLLIYLLKHDAFCSKRVNVFRQRFVLSKRIAVRMTSMKRYLEESGDELIRKVQKVDAKVNDKTFGGTLPTESFSDARTRSLQDQIAQPDFVSSAQDPFNLPEASAGEDQGDAPATAEPDEKPISKNQQKKLKRREQWEAGREQRKEVRRVKTKERRVRHREQKHAAAAEDGQRSSVHQLDEVATEDDAEKEVESALGPKGAGAVGTDEDKEQASACAPTSTAISAHAPNRQANGKRGGRPQPSQLPITFILDCSWEDLMLEKEVISLSSQITRCYSDAYKARYRAHLAVSSFGGKLKERYDVALSGQYQGWKNVRFREGDLVEVAEEAKKWMKEPRGGRMEGMFRGQKAKPEEESEVVYLSSDASDTLTELKPYGIYIIGGLVDKNRHKGVCYKRATGKGIRTAKLPIGDYLNMTSRPVLAINHVNEIMFKWLELGDWGQAFMQVMPKRKGVTLKSSSIAIDDEGDEDTDGEEGEKAEESVPEGVEDMAMRHTGTTVKESSSLLQNAELLTSQ